MDEPLRWAAAGQRSIVVQRNGETAKRGSKAAGGPRPLWRDVRTATLDELTAELKAVNDELFRTSMKTQRGQELFSTRRMLMKEVARRERVPRIDAVRRDLDLLAGRQEAVLDAARFTHRGLKKIAVEVGGEVAE